MSDHPPEFHQQTIDANLQDDLSQIMRLAVREDLDRGFDLTTVALVPAAVQASAAIVARRNGVAAGISLLPMMLEELDAELEAKLLISDAEHFSASQSLAVLHGNARDLLTCERILLNTLGRMCGIATFTHQHVEQLEGLRAKLYDTRKTTPGFRRLEKYAVRCGGGTNHRSGLYEAIMIKDNHLALRAQVTDAVSTLAEAVVMAREFLAGQSGLPSGVIVEVEVDSLEQFQELLPAGPDIILLDNMNTEQLSRAVEIRDAVNPSIQLEASGGINLATLRAVGETGVDRISLGALTHSAVNLDLGLDWLLDGNRQVGLMPEG
ncbi:MAG: carboxylating nicotinate-nucleotide diphosphorylase [bacterium]|nr:carboxylating nicotinate-nucleotide diphosphorylase [bacterium]